MNSSPKHTSAGARVLTWARQHRPSHTLVVAYAALAVALGGTSFAVAMFTGANIVNGSLSGADIKNSSLTGTDVGTGRLTGSDIANGSITGLDVTALTSADVTNQSLLAADFAAGELPAGTPSGAVLTFDLASCPTGWSEFTAARGRYLVGKPAGGTLGGTAGTELVDVEDRVTGKHTHTASAITPTATADTGWAWEGTADSGIIRRPLFGFKDDDAADPDIPPLAFGLIPVTIDETGLVDGTNAPYVQLLACRKD